MKRNLPLIFVLLCAVFFAIPRAPRAQGELPEPSKVASPHAYVSLEPVPRGRTFEIAVVVGIMSGFHMNSHTPSEDYLIPTVLTPKLPAGIHDLGINYPSGIAKKLSFSEKPLSVYTKSFTVHVKLAAASNAPLGKTRLPFTLQYQACNESACLPPVRIPVNAEIEVASAGAKSHPASPKIFGKRN